ncbi:MAG: tetratricopeptide repeat protein, partial [Gemmataceae bacterium]
MWFVVLIAGFLIGMMVFLALSPWARRKRALHQAQISLTSGDWPTALKIAEELASKASPGAWQPSCKALLVDCLEKAISSLKKEKRFEEAMERVHHLSKIKDCNPQRELFLVVDAAQEELRAKFATGKTESAEFTSLIEECHRLEGGFSEEACVWSALSQIRQGNLEQAVAIFQRIHPEEGQEMLEMPLYMGMLLHRLGKPQEALRYLADANRIDSNCPLIGWQMGLSLVASGGDLGLAIRVLRKAVGDRGLAAFSNSARDLWAASFSATHSFVGRLLERNEFTCPLLGDDVGPILRQANFALAQALHRQEQFQEAAEIYSKLLQEAPPTMPLLRGYGQVLARLGQHDQAYKYLRLALDRQDPKEPMTAAYLALCGALGKPTNPEDKPRNLTWAMNLFTRFSVPSNAEWVSLIRAVAHEADRTGHPLTLEQRIQVLDALTSIQAMDASAVNAYRRLYAEHPAAVRPIYLWLVARAVTRDVPPLPSDLPILNSVMAEVSAAREYFDQQGWDFSDVEYLFLKQSGESSPGRFPPVLGDYYPRRGESLLLDRSLKSEQAGHSEEALVAAETWVRLASRSTAALNRLACLRYRKGDLDRTVELLEKWHELVPNDPLPLVRLGLVEHHRGRDQRREEILSHAMDRSPGKLRAELAYMTATLSLRKDLGQESLQRAQNHLAHCLDLDPEHEKARCCQAAVSILLGDREALEKLAPSMDRSDSSSSFHPYLASVVHILTRREDRAMDLIRPCLEESDLAVEARYVLGWAPLLPRHHDSGHILWHAVARA